jgi:histidinol phosphatase-like PHP family hydrolase
MYKFDTHVHTSETSPCGHISAAETIRLYKEAGFSGVCITDHYNRRYFEAWKLGNWEETVKRYLTGYHNAKEYGDKNGFVVLLGTELKLDDSPNEYLLFGITEDFLYNYPQLYIYKINELKKLAENNGIMIFQAHPFRPNLTRENPLYIDGAEVVNGNLRHNSHNDMALEFALKNNLLMTGGSDCHEIEDVGKSGIITEERIDSAKILLRILKTGSMKVIQL